MAAVKQPSTRKFLSTEDVAAIFERNRKSEDPLSDFSSTTEGSDLTDFWDSSATDDDITDSEYSDSPTDFSGSSPAEISSSQYESGEESDTCDKGWELMEGRQLRPRKRTLLTVRGEFHDQPPRKKSRLTEMVEYEDEQIRSLNRGGGRDKGQRDRDQGCGGRGRGQGCGGRGQGQGSGGRGRGQGSGGRGRGQGSGGRGRGQGSGGRGQGQGSGRQGQGQHGGRGEGSHSLELSGEREGKGKGKGKKALKLPGGVKSIDEEEGIELIDEFCPIREQGPHLPQDMEVSALSLFELFFDSVAVERICTSTLAYAEAKKTEKRYDLFTRQQFTKAVLMAFIGALILLGIHRVRNHRKAWSSARAQVIVRLSELMTCQRFELVGSFLHVVSPEEAAMASDRLKKLRPLLNHIKAKCLEYYQPLQHLSVDERMVKSKSRCHMIQYMKDKPTKWGFKLWVVADMSGYTVDFNIYTGKAEQSSEYGLTYDVVMKLVQPFHFQGYQVFVDNYYSSPTLFLNLLEVDIRATGTLRTYRRGVPATVVELKAFL